MADIENKISTKYGIDINQINIPKLYKIDRADISPEELEQKIADCRKKWNQSINGANEKFAERDRNHLERADRYEEILRNEKLREELLAYYKKGPAAGGANGVPGNTEFAREYFSLVATTKKIKKKDVEFFFTYFQEERKHKKAILEMLHKEYKVAGLGSEKRYANEDDSTEEAGKEKRDSSPLIVNRFQEATLLKIHKCESFYQKARESAELCQRYPSLRESMYDYLELDKAKDLESMKTQVAKQREEVFAQRQERGTEYAVLLDLFNSLNDILNYRDVVDNFPEFKLLMKYPKLTPYMHEFEDMKQSTINGILEIANRDYRFRDVNDFILSYFQIIYDNFNINDSAIKSILKKAEKSANANKILNGIDEKLGRKRERTLPVGVNIIHWLAYWPIFMVYVVFEVFKAIFTRMKKLAIPVFIILFALLNWMLPKMYEFENLLVLRKIFVKAEWYAFVGGVTKGNLSHGFLAFLLSLIVIILLVMLYVLPPLMIAMFVYESAGSLSDHFDWIGLERTFQNILQTIRKKTEDQYMAQKKSFFKNKVPRIMVNIACLITVLLMVRYVPIGFRIFSEKTGYFQRSEHVEWNLPEEGSANEEEVSEAETEALEAMVITASSANIRSGPGTNYDVMTVANQGEVFWATGNEQPVGSSGTIWYELYLSEDRTQVGWASQKVIDFQ